MAGGAGDTLTLDDARATAVFRTIQEFLTNVARYRGEKEGDSLAQVRSRFHRVDGQGFDPAVALEGHSFGLLGMQEGGRLSATLDLSMPVISAVVLIRRVKTGWPTLPIPVLE